MKLDFQLSDDHKERIKRRNRIRLKIAGVCFALALVGLLLVRIIT